MRSVIIALGFGLFRTASSHIYSTAFGSTRESVGFVSDLTFVLVFNAASLLAGAVLFILVKRKKVSSGMLFQIPSLIVLAIGYMCLAFPVFPDAYALFFLVIVSALGGFCVVILWATWLEIFAAQEKASTAAYQLIGGFVTSGLLGIVITYLPSNVNGYLALAALCLSVIMYEFIKRSTPLATELTSIERRKDRNSLVNTFVCFFILVAVVGILHTSLLNTPSQHVVGAAPAWVSTIVSTVIVVVLVVLMGERLKPDIVYKVCFPLMVIILSLLPFLAGLLGSSAGVLVITIYKICNMVIVLYIVYEARRLQLSTYLLVGCYMLGSCLFLLLGLGIGLALNAASAQFEISLITLLAFVAIYPLIAALMFLARKSKLQQAGNENPNYEEKHSEYDIQHYVDALSQEHALTKREKEILSYLVRGRSARFIAETLVISENTVWFHIKKIYVKLNVHSKQELLDLIG